MLRFLRSTFTVLIGLVCPSLLSESEFKFLNSSGLFPRRSRSLYLPKLKICVNTNLLLVFFVLQGVIYCEEFKSEVLPGRPLKYEELPEFRASLQPSLDELLSGDIINQRRSVISLRKQAVADDLKLDDASFRRTEKFLTWHLAVLADECPQEERDLFCNVITSLLVMKATPEKREASALAEMICDRGFNQPEIEGNYVKALNFWMSSPLCNYLLKGKTNDALLLQEIAIANKARKKK